MTYNPCHEDDRLQSRIAAAFAAVSEHFSHIAVRHIVSPPAYSWSDAYAARHIAHRIMVYELGISRKRLTRLRGYSKLTIMRSLRIAEERMECPVFRKAYDKMAARALELLQEPDALEEVA